MCRCIENCFLSKINCRLIDFFFPSSVFGGLDILVLFEIRNRMLAGLINDVSVVFYFSFFKYFSTIDILVNVWMGIENYENMCGIFEVDFLLYASNDEY